MDERSLDSLLLRHGEVVDLSRMIERGEKPPYDTFVDFQEGKIDPPIDSEATAIIIRNKIKNGLISPGGFDTIITSPKLRAIQTGELFNTICENNSQVRTSEYLKEVNVPMQGITREFYDAAPDLAVIRKAQMRLLATGAKIDEDIFDVYKRAEKFLEYFHRIGRLTAKQPLFITHAIFARFLELAIRHQGQKMDEQATRDMILKEFSSTQRPGVIEGFELNTSAEGIKIARVI